MARSNNVDVVATLGLQGQHEMREGIVIDLLSPSKMADIVVLAENAKKVAMGYKDGPGTMLSHQWPFLAEMGVDRGDSCKPGCLAKAGLSGKPVHLALPGTHGAGFKDPFSLLYTLAEYSGFERLYVRRGKGHRDLSP